MQLANLRRFSANINANCRMQYSRLCYRLLVREKIAPNLRATVITSLGSAAEQESIFRELRMMNDVFHLYSTQMKYKEAYDVAVNIGFLEEALHLANNHNLLHLVARPVLAEVSNYAHAGYILTNRSGLGNPKANLMIDKDITSTPRKEENLSLDQLWKSATLSIKNYSASGKKPNRSQFQDSRMRGFFDILVRCRWHLH